MSDLDLTAAVESAARIMHDANCCDRWDSHGNSFRETWRAEAREVLSAVAPVIAAQARREALTELAERLRGAERDLLNHDPGQRDKRLAEGTRLALRIKADGIRLALGYIEEALR